MEQPANQRSEIAHATFDLEVSDYEQHLIDGVCTRCGKEPARRDKDGDIISNLGKRCHEKVKAYQRKYAKKRRKQWKRKKKCRRCGKKRVPGSWGCAACLIELGRLSKRGRPKKTVVDPHVDQSGDSGWDDRLEQSPDGKLRTRRRFHGQGKRGRQSGSQLDHQALYDALHCIGEGERGLEKFRSPEVQAMGKVSREDARAAAVDKLRQAQRWIDEVIDRHVPKSQRRDRADETDE